MKTADKKEFAIGQQNFQSNSQSTDTQGGKTMLERKQCHCITQQQLKQRGKRVKECSPNYYTCQGRHYFASSSGYIVTVC